MVISFSETRENSLLVTRFQYGAKFVYLILDLMLYFEGKKCIIEMNWEKNLNKINGNNKQLKFTLTSISFPFCNLSRVWQKIPFLVIIRRY